MDGPAPVSAAQIVEEAMAAYERGDLDSLAQFVHPEAEIEMMLLGGEPARGPAGLRDALTAAREGIHRPTVTSIEGIADDAAVLVGRVQHGDPQGVLSDRKAVWLTVLREGKIWRTRVLASTADASAAYDELALAGRRSDATRTP